MRGQLGLEYLIAYAMSFVMAAVAASSALNFIGGGGVSTYTPAACMVSAELVCQGGSVSSSTGLITFKISNNMGTNVIFPQNSFAVKLSSYSTSYAGSCSQANSIITCNAVLPQRLQAGSQVNVVFNIGYSLCASGRCQPELNTTGTSTLYVS